MLFETSSEDMATVKAWYPYLMLEDKNLVDEDNKVTVLVNNHNQFTTESTHKGLIAKSTR